MKQNVIVINLDKWTTITHKASYTIGKTTGQPVSVEYICKLIRKGKLKTKRIDALDITLVER